MAEIRNRGKRADGSVRWEARYYGPDGERIPKTFRTKQEAKNWLNRQQAAKLDGLHIDPRKGDLKLVDVADEYRETWTDLEPKTRAGYESILNRHLIGPGDPATDTPAGHFRAYKLARISPKVVQRYVNELGADGYAPNTIRRIFGVLNQLLRLAVERRYIAVNPCDAVKLPKKRGKRREISITPLTHEQVRALSNKIDERWRVAVLL